MIPTWHQRHAAAIAYRLRNFSAHILAPDYIITGKTLCGVKNPRVYIDASRRGNPLNKCCKRCAALYEKAHPEMIP